ncbi:nitrate ABC transporter substrate-binding protein [Corticibacter populi]|uniref:Nitrate ABC transporter substrate-binding protein n=1 Tax=Corticibacter populi TaxID=1550736 RepID=A0A3M6R0J3_9BURK|nr:CmpA/NrtA family ABC transporter substrate-binding protein [Corticibacter populi]RMX08693.1 nitrate ABC transporter substrate-binding protein [Corticibacter populi]RZS36037.1 nitrate/nitrite transport system substrate-binding protein [Corticibacter populi]
MTSRPHLPQAPQPAADADASTNGGTQPDRRRFLRVAAAAGSAYLFSSLGHPGAWAAGSDAPEKKEVKIGFIPLTDCASVVMASVLGLDEKYGVKIVPSKEANWATIRDKLVNGENDFSHILYGQLVGLQVGIGGPQTNVASVMTLNRNGQGISLSKKIAEAGATDLVSLVALMKQQPREYTFAQTFPTGTHAMWLYYWLGSAGVNPMKDVKVITVPPPQMVANARVGNMDGFSVGEPWNQRGILDGVSVHAASSQDVWKDHPEKVLGTTAAFADANPNTCRAVAAAIIEAGRWIDASDANKEKMAETIAARSYVNTDKSAIIDRILGKYDNGLGKKWNDPDHMKFYDDGQVNYPYLSDASWFLTQHKRWGLLDAHPDYEGVAKAVNRIELYKQAATAAGAPVPGSDLRSSTLMDGKVWDGSDPKAYADSFDVKA